MLDQSLQSSFSPGAVFWGSSRGLLRASTPLLQRSIPWRVNPPCSCRDASSSLCRLPGQEYVMRGFPDGPTAKNPPASAGDARSVPGSGRLHRPWGTLAHALQLLKLASLEPALRSRRSRHSEKRVRRSVVPAPHSWRNCGAAKNQCDRK